jgi:CO/xanthine dehydrogenase FAD-binding subunit
MRVRKSIDYPLLGVALNLCMEKDNKTIQAITLALTAVEKAPLLIKQADELKGQTLSDALIDGLAEAAYKRARPIKNTYGYTPDYRKNMVRTYVKSAVLKSLECTTRQGGVA